jgi:GT2 family glycosyltransferase
MLQTPFISTVVVTYEREQVLVDTITHLLRQEYPTWELIVVDQTPVHTLETNIFLEEHGDHLQLIRLDRPSMTHARNVGTLVARGEIVFFCDDDIIPLPGLLAAHARHYADPSVGGVTGPTDLPLETAPLRASVVYPSGQVVAYRNASTSGETDSAFGGNMSWRRDLLLRVGGFDEGFIMRAHREETDVSLRVRSLGYRLVHDPAAAVEHLRASSGSRIDQDQLDYVYGWFHNTAYFYSKHFAPLALPAFLRYQAGHLVRIIAGSRRPGAAIAWLRGLVSGYRAGARQRAAVRRLRLEKITYAGG